MGIPAKEIGWSNASNLLWQISKQLEYLKKIIYSIYRSTSLPPEPISLPVIETDSGVVSLTSLAYVSPENQKLANYYFPFLGLNYPYTGVPVNTFASLGTSISFSSFGSLDIIVSNVESLEFNSPTSASFSLGTLKSLTFPDLLYVYTTQISGPITFIAGSVFTDFNAPKLEFISNGLTFSTVMALPTISFPSLKVINGNITNSNVALQTLNLPELLQGGFIDSTNSGLQSVNLPKIKILSLLTLSGTKSSLTSIQLPVVEYSSTISFPSSSTALTTFSFGNSLKYYGSSATTGNFITTSNSLDQASVDNILISLANLDGTNGTTILSGRTITITGSSATPSAAGLIAKATLVSRGCTVTTN